MNFLRFSQLHEGEVVEATEQEPTLRKEWDNPVPGRAENGSTRPSGGSRELRLQNNLVGLCVVSHGYNGVTLPSPGVWRRASRQSIPVAQVTPTLLRSLGCSAEAAPWAAIWGPQLFSFLPSWQQNAWVEAFCWTASILPTLPREEEEITPAMESMNEGLRG